MKGVGQVTTILLTFLDASMNAVHKLSSKKNQPCTQKTVFEEFFPVAHFVPATFTDQKKLLLRDTLLASLAIPVRGCSSTRTLEREFSKPEKPSLIPGWCCKMPLLPTYTKWNTRQPHICNYGLCSYGTR